MDAATVVAIAAIIAAAMGGIAQIITANNGRKVLSKLDGNSAELEKIHPLVNSNMTRMFIAVGVQSFFILVLVWFGLKEAQKPKDMEMGLKEVGRTSGGRSAASASEPANV